MHIQPKSIAGFLLAAILATLAVNAAADDAAQRPQMIWPKQLNPGDTIMFVSPAGPVERKPVMQAKAHLEARGYRVKMRDDVLAVEGYLAGSDQRRAEELMQAFLDPEVQGVFCTRGGYGTMRILDQLDYEQIREHPKVFTGFSDITALHAALNRHAGLVTFHSPSALGEAEEDAKPRDFSMKYLFRAVEAVEDSSAGYAIELPEGKPPIIPLGKGKARGRLVGGNLSLISAIEGTPYAIDTRDAILLVEDVREAPYRIDRMLCQLRLAGKLKQIRGAVLGQFTLGYDREDQLTEDDRYSVDGVLRQYFENAGIPVLMNFPVGHHELNAALPLGGEVEIDAHQAVLRVLGR